MPAFDISELSQRSARRSRSMRIAFGLVGGMCTGIAVWFLLLALQGLHDQLQWLVVIVVEACSLSLLALEIYATWNLREPPTGVATGDAGISFQWRSGRVERLPWSHLTRHFVLLDYSVNPTVVRLLPYFQWEVRRWNRPPTPLTKPAFDSILSEAATHGLAPVTKNLPNPWRGWAPCRATWFSISQARARSPPPVTP